MPLLNARGFTADDFALSHPGGSLGKRLLLRLSDIMHQGERLPVVPENALIKDALVEMSLKGLGMTAVVNANNNLLDYLPMVIYAEFLTFKSTYIKIK